jgi:hypothetical protein
MQKTSYNPTSANDTNLALAQVLNGHKTYWSKNGATVRYYHEPAPHWSWITPDGGGHSPKSDDAFIAVADYLA